MQKRPVAVRINIDGPVGSGKTAVINSVKDMIESYGYCVAVPSRELRYEDDSLAGKYSTKPDKDDTVFVLSETWHHG